MMWYAGGGIHWCGWLLGVVLMVAFWGLVIWGIWYIFSNMGRGWGRPTDRPMDRQTPREILDERLARGEISPEEYRHLLGMMAEGHGRSGSDQQPVGGPGART